MKPSDPKSPRPQVAFLSRLCWLQPCTIARVPLDNKADFCHSFIPLSLLLSWCSVIRALKGTWKDVGLLFSWQLPAFKGFAQAPAALRVRTPLAGVTFLLSDTTPCQEFSFPAALSPFHPSVFTAIHQSVDCLSLLCQSWTSAASIAAMTHTSHCLFLYGLPYVIRRQIRFDSGGPRLAWTSFRSQVAENRNDALQPEAKQKCFLPN